MFMDTALFINNSGGVGSFVPCPNVLDDTTRKEEHFLAVQQSLSLNQRSWSGEGVRPQIQQSSPQLHLQD